MMTYSYYLVGLITLIISVYKFFASFFQRDPLAEIPGPRGVPILGYLPFIGRKINLTFNRLWLEYGDVYRIRIGYRTIVVLNGHDTLRRALVDKSIDFAGRPDYYTYKMVSRESLVGVNDYSERYRVAKKVLLKAFGNFKTEKKEELQKSAHHSVNQMINLIKHAKNEPFDPDPHMYPIVCLMMGYICWGEYFDVNDERVKHVLGNANEFGTAMALGVLCDFFPGLKSLFRWKFKKLESLMAAKKAYTRTLSCKHVSTYDGQQMRDITDFFHKVEEEMSEDVKKTLNLCQKDLLSISGTLFGAGFATITLTTKWAIMLLAKHPEIQAKMQEELDQVVGKERMPFLDDMKNLPYSMAVVYEVYRYSSVAFMGFCHKTVCDTEINGYFLPKGTALVTNYYSAHRDPKYFTDADQFQPERFLDETGALTGPLIDRVIPYGLGMRRCGGEIMARLQIFTFITTLIHKCYIEESPLEPINLDHYKATVALNPKPFKVVMRSRFGEW
nr:cytochrome P450 18a1 [Diamesa zernyi]